MECMWPEWSQWSEWSNNCDNDVGEGLRRRSCSVEMPNPGCPGETTETRECIEKVTCPECWQLNADKTACEISDTTCFEISCDGARLTFSFLPKMFGIDDLSHNFGVIGLEKNEDLQKYEYSRGFGNNGQDRA